MLVFTARSSPASTLQPRRDRVSEQPATCPASIRWRGACNAAPRIRDLLSLGSHAESGMCEEAGDRNEARAVSEYSSRPFFNLVVEADDGHE
jgi:hypothetical protein